MSDSKQGRGQRSQTQRLPEHERGAGGNVRRTERLDPADDEWRQAEPVNPGWRSERSGSRRATRRGPLPTSPQEFQLWLQAGGWRYVAGIAVLTVVLLIALLAFARSEQRQAGLDGSQLAPTTGAVSGAVPLTQLPTVTLPPATPTGPRRFVVQNTGIEGLLLRPAPSRANDPLATLPDGTVVEQIDEDLTAETIAWRHVRAADGQEGYVAADFLTPAP